MARTFTDANELLADLLLRHERGSIAPFAKPDRHGFASVADYDEFTRRLAEAERCGAVSVRRGKGRASAELALIRMADPAALYALLGRIPSSQTSGEAVAAVLAGLDLAPEFVRAVEEAGEAWCRNRSWNGLGSERGRDLRVAVRLAKADRGHGRRSVPRWRTSP